MSNLENNLRQFSGSEEFYQHWSKHLIYTEGVKYLAENGGGQGAYWLIDAIASYQPTIKRLGVPDVEDFQIWVLKREPYSDRPDVFRATLTMHDDLPGDALITQQIEFTDFALDEIKLYLERGEHMTLMLPGER